MDYTELFSRAVTHKEGYSFKTVKERIDRSGDAFCGDPDAWADNIWYRLTPRQDVSYDRCYGFLCSEFPVALLTEHCPVELMEVLQGSEVICAPLEEPMSCDEEVLRQYLRHRAVFDESRFLDDPDSEDERFGLVLRRLETGRKDYVDSGCFQFREIR